ncbi:MAG: sodium-dependent transporter, partial [Nitrospinota bacterium]
GGAMSTQREQWRTRRGFLFAAIGSAIGLGNIWRFSYVTYTNGGAAFLIPYIVSLITAGIPILILEFGLGHRMGVAAPLAFRRIHRRWEILGWWPILFIMLGIQLYYTVIIGWCVNYLAYAVRLSWGTDANAFFFKTFLHLSGGPWEVGTPVGLIVVGVALVWVANWLICTRGIQKGVEVACQIFMPLLVVLITILIVRGLTLPGATDGLLWYLRPDFSKLANLAVWRSAYSQTFFSLSIAFGIMITYASYLPRKADITGNAIITACSDAGFSIFAGFAVFTTLGFMAHTSGLPFEKVVTQGIGLAFVAYPKAINAMPYLPTAIGVAFFLALILAGLSSSVSILEAFATSLMDEYGIGRGVTITASCLVGFLLSLIFTTRGGLFWLDIVDHYILQYGLVVVGLLECLVVGWIFGAHNLRRHVNATSAIRIGRVWDFFVKYLTPAVLGVILVGTLIEEVRAPYGGYPRAATLLIGVGWLVVTLLAAWFITTRRKRLDIKHLLDGL